jgi:hypothetical protein
MTKGKKPGEKKSDLVSVQMFPSMKKEITARAKAEDVTVGHWCRSVFRDKLERRPARAQSVGSTQAERAVA